MAPKFFSMSLAAATALAALPADPADAGRLFGTGRADNSTIVELDPVTGGILNSFSTPPGGDQNGLAFDGTSLWFIGEALNTLYQLDPDTGLTLNTFDLPAEDHEPNNPRSSKRAGLASLNGLIYITLWDFQVQDIEVFDPSVGEVINVLDIDGMNPETREFGNSGLAAISGPDQLIVSTAVTQEIHFIDPTTGLIESTIRHDQFGVLGIAVVDGELYFGSDQVGPDFDGIENIHVYDRDLNPLRTIEFPVTNGISSLAGDPAVPEPGSAVLVALGAVALTRRRRR